MSPVPGEVRDLSLLDYARILRRRAWIVAMAVLVVVGTVVALSLQQDKVYRAEGELLVRTSRNVVLSDDPTPADPARTVETEIRVLLSPAVRDAVREELGSAPEVSAEAVENTDIIEISAESTEPKRAARAVNAYADAYIEQRQKREADAVFDLTERIQARITDLDNRIAEIDANIAAAPEEERDERAALLEPERGELVDQRVVYRQRLDQLSFDASVEEGGAQLVKPATAPDAPVRPNPVRNGLVALGIGLLLGIGAAFLVDYVDDSVKTEEDLERAAGPDVPVLGHIPTVEWKGKARNRVISLVSPASPAVEAYRSLRTAVQFLGLDRPMRVLQVTSPIAAEGKTTTVVNLATVLARAGQRVIVVDCDLRRPRIHEYFDVPATVGFTSVLIGTAPLSSALVQIPGDERLPLSLLPCGPIPPNPSELLSSRLTIELMDQLKSHADVVLVDSPPVLPVTDAAVVSTWVDATLVVAMAGLTTRKRMHRAVEKLQQVDARVVGTVLNRTARESEYGYSYRYYGRSPRSDKLEEARATR